VLNRKFSPSKSRTNHSRDVSIHKMKITVFIISLFFIASCSDSKWNGEWGATVGDCDEICTIYHSAQKELMKEFNLYDKDFPNKEERRKHIVLIDNGHKINSWFRVVTDNNDTTINEFSCKVYYDEVKIKYVVTDLKYDKVNLKQKNNKKLVNDTVTIDLEYYGWGCPCPQWITPKNKILYESKDNVLNLFMNVIPENDSLPNPLDLTEDMENLHFEFKGRFFVEPQLLGDEGEQGPAKTLLYYEVKHKK